MGKINVDHDNLKQAAEIIRALTHPLRMKILAFIDKNKTINVNKIYNTLKLEQSITSQHLRILRNAGIVNAKREGKFIFYTVNYKKIDHINKIVKDFIK